jgi:hypothetical protein
VRIGELLLGQRKVRPSELQRCVDEQAAHGKRLVSLLIRVGALEFDDGSRALGEQHGMACVLAKHLAAREPMLAAMIPAELARAWCALPIGRSKGALIVCVRDPGAQLKAQLEKQIRGDVMLVISPALRLEGLVADTYGPAPPEEFDVALDSALDLDPAPTPPKPPTPPTSKPQPPPPIVPPMPDMHALDPESVRLSLTDLDDARVTKDPTQSGQLTAAAKAQPRPGSKARTTLPPPPPTIAATSEALELAGSRDDATEAVIRFLAGHWVAGLVLAIREEAAIGYRGHGDAIGQVESLVVSLLSPSTVQRAVETRKTAIQGYTSATQEELARRLGTVSPSASPVLVTGQVVAVIVVGDAIHGKLGDTERALAELGKLAQLLGTAWERVLGTR